MLQAPVAGKLPSDLENLHATFRRLQESLDQAHAYVQDVVVRAQAWRWQGLRSRVCSPRPGTCFTGRTLWCAAQAGVCQSLGFTLDPGTEGGL